jgi:hypothetical protein
MTSDPDWTWETIWTKKIKDCDDHEKPKDSDNLKEPVDCSWTNYWPDDQGVVRKDIALCGNKHDIDECFPSDLKHRTWIALIENSLPSFMRNKLTDNTISWPLIEVRRLPLWFYGISPNEDGKKVASMSLYCLIWKNTNLNSSKEKKEIVSPFYVLGYFIAGCYGLRILDFKKETLDAVISDYRHINRQHQQIRKFEILFSPYEAKPLDKSLSEDFKSVEENTTNQQNAKSKNKTESNYQFIPIGWFLQNKIELPNNDNKKQIIEFDNYYIWNHQIPNENKFPKIMPAEVFEILKNKEITKGLTKAIVEINKNGKELTLDFINYKLRRNRSWKRIFPNSKNNSTENLKSVITKLSNINPAYKPYFDSFDHLNETLGSNDQKPNVSYYNWPSDAINQDIKELFLEESLDPILIWKKELPFYPGYDLYELIDWRFTKPRHARFLLNVNSNDAVIISLNGKSSPIHDLNLKILKEKPLEEDFIADYLHFFCTNIEGKEGFFTIVEQPDSDINWLEGMGGRFQKEELKKCLIDAAASIDKVNNGQTEKIQDLIWSISKPQLKTGKKKKGEDVMFWESHALLCYGRYLFLATFHVHPDGEVEMYKDYPIATDLMIQIDKRTDATYFNIDDAVGPGQVMRSGYEFLRRN